MKLATSQNKAGIGYDEYETPWWEKVYNDASRNVKVESHGDQVSLAVVNDTGAGQTRGGKLLHSFTKATISQMALTFVQTESVLHGSLKVGVIRDQKLHVTRDEAAHETTGHKLTSNGKSERIAEHDRVNLNAQSQLNATLVGKNVMTYRKTNVESDMESSEHEVDNNASVSQFKVDNNANVSQFKEGKHFFLSKSTKKKHRRRMQSLEQQLSTCNLQENNVKHDILNNNKLNKKLSQKMKKNREEKLNSLLSHLVKNDIKRIDQVSMELSDCVKLVHNPHSNHMRKNSANKRTLLHEQVKKLWKSLTDQTSDNASEVERCENEKESIGHKIKPNPELRNNIEGVTNKRDWIEINVKEKAEEERRQRGYIYLDSMVPVLSCPLRIEEKITEDYIKYIKSLNKESFTRERQTEIRDSKKYTKIQKRRKRLKCNIKKNFEHSLKVKHLTNEINMDSVIKDLEECGLAEKVNTIKKRPTQTHLTPV